ncbi:MAG TPA: acetylxylan esterase [Chryseosolibacter sp.]
MKKNRLPSALKAGRLFLKLGLLTALSGLLNPCPARAQSDSLNYDESRIPPYQLPELLVSDGGKVIRTPAAWESIRRPEILRKFTENVYGRVPGKPADIHYKTTFLDQHALGGKATREEVTIYFTKGEQGPSMVVLLYLPNGVKGKVPVFVGLNFTGNHAVQDDSTITVTENWKRINTNNAPTLKNLWPAQRSGWAPARNNKTPHRGEEEHRWPVATLIENGYGLATAYYEDVEADTPDGWKNGVRGKLQKELKIKPAEWGSISVWAWSLSRIMDYLETDERVNAREVVVTGLSRLGKTALWAGANDQRFAIVISNDSGEGGAALSKRIYGETIELINRVNPHWFIEKYKTFNFAPEKLPVHHHMLIALAAPRPVYIASAIEDKPADPKGEFLSGKFAAPAYTLYGKTGLGVAEQPPVDTPVGETVGYHVRRGGHDITLYDWQQFIKFANRHFSYSFR